MKKILKTVIMLCHSIFSQDTSPKVVFYHDIGKKWTQMGTEPYLFWKHMSYLRDDDILCFDDGFRGIWEIKDKISQKLHLKNKIIVFLAVDLIGKPNYLTWSEIKELQNKYRIEFQCHTWSHQTLAGPYNPDVQVPKNGRTDKWFYHELVDSKLEIEKQLNKNVTSLCFPVGYFSNDVIRRCKEAGYEKVYTSFPGNLTNSYLQPRCIVQDLSTIAFKYVLKGGMMAFEKRYKLLHDFS